MRLNVFVGTVFMLGTCANSQDYSMCNNTNLIITRVTTEATCLASFSGVLVIGISFDVYCSSLLTGLECAANVTMAAYDAEVMKTCYQTMTDHVIQNANAVFNTVNATLQLLNIPFTINEDYVVNTSKCVADSLSTESSSGGGIEGYVIAIIVICVVIVLAGAAVGAYFLLQKHNLPKKANRGQFDTDGTNRPSTSISPNQIQPLQLDAEAMHYADPNVHPEK